MKPLSSSALTQVEFIRPKGIILSSPSHTVSVNNPTQNTKCCNAANPPIFKSLNPSQNKGIERSNPSSPPSHVLPRVHSIPQPKPSIKPPAQAQSHNQYDPPSEYSDYKRQVRGFVPLCLQHALCLGGRSRRIRGRRRGGGRAGS